MFMVANVAFWLFFWMDITYRATSYAGWGLDPEAADFAPSIGLMRLLQQPALAIVERVFNGPPGNRLGGSGLVGLVRTVALAAHTYAHTADNPYHGSPPADLMPYMHAGDLEVEQRQCPVPAG